MTSVQDTDQSVNWDKQEVEMYYTDQEMTSHELGRLAGSRRTLLNMLYISDE